MAKQTKITKSARGEDCQVRIPEVCNRNPETTVFCHINGGGMGIKVPDFFGAYGCSSCHSWLDGGYTQTPNMSVEEVKLYHLEAMVRTQALLLEKKLIKIYV